MDITQVLTEIRRRLNLNRVELSRELGFKSSNMVWLYEQKQRKPNIATCNKIIDLAKNKAYFKVEYWMLRDDLR